MVEIWAEYFDELLKLASESDEEDISFEIPQQQDTKTELETNCAEVAEAIRSLKNHKASDEDLITANCLKYGVDILNVRIHNIWQQKKMPEE